ncbi:MAG TPA: VWA domain-containing protein, partial [Terriglobales bacterium]
MPLIRSAVNPRLGILLNGLAIFLLCSTILPAQQTSSPQKPPEPDATPLNSSATFKTQTDLVLVPVVVKDKKGKPVEGLPKDAFSLEENGTPQAISLFEEFRSPLIGATPSAIVDQGHSNLGYSNAKELRLTLLVLDLLNTTPLQRTDGKEDFIKFLNKGLVGNQPVSLLCITSKGLKLVHPLTTDTNALIEALKKLPIGAESIMPLENRTFSTIWQLRDIAQAYLGVPGRKTMIFAAGHLPSLIAEGSIYESSTYAPSLHRMWKSLVDSNISIYPIRLLDWARNPARGGPASDLSLRLREFSDATGGNACLESNDLMGCLSDAIDDSRAYYMLGFQVQSSDRKPGWRTLKVKVAADHAEVRARDGFYYGVPPFNDAKSVRDEEVNALASPLGYSGVPMFVKVLPPGAASATAGKAATAFLITIPITSVLIDASRPNPLDLDVGAIALNSKDT